MGNWHGRLAGQVELVLRGPDPAWALNRLCAARVPFWDVDWRDSFTVALTVPARASERARAEAGRAMCDCETGPVRGLPRQLERLLRRPVLLLFLLLNLAAIVVLPPVCLFLLGHGQRDRAGGADSPGAGGPGRGLRDLWPPTFGPNGSRTTCSIP